MTHWQTLREEFDNIRQNQPVFPGDVISHTTAYELERRGLILRNANGCWIVNNEQIIKNILRNDP